MLNLSVPKKGKRAPGWDVLRQWFHNAREPGQRHDGDPALYINKSYCPVLISEIQNAMPDLRDLSDVGSLNDHALDATRYLITSRAIKEPGVTFTSLQRRALTPPRPKKTRRSGFLLMA